MTIWLHYNAAASPRQARRQKKNPIGIKKRKQGLPVLPFFRKAVSLRRTYELLSAPRMERKAESALQRKECGILKNN
jgi:hypothetical protein